MPNACMAHASKVASVGTAMSLIIASSLVVLHSATQGQEYARMFAQKHNASCYILRPVYPLANADYAQLIRNARLVPVSNKVYVAIAMLYTLVSNRVVLHFALPVLRFVLFALKHNVNKLKKDA
jgi:hypothetical protein